MINFNYILNWVSFGAVIVNFGWLVEMIVNAFMQYNDLQQCAVKVTKDRQTKPIWKLPLIIISSLSFIALLLMIMTALGIPKDIKVYIYTLIILVIQLLFNLDYAHTINKLVDESWYAKSIYWSVAFNIISLISLFAYLVTLIATTGIGI